MPAGDGLYAHIETEFIRDSKFLALPVGARMLYLSIWCYALAKKREIIERPSDHFLATLAGLSRHPIATYTRLLRDSKLLFETADHMWVVGLREKHSKIKFKPEFEISQEEFENFRIPSFLSFPFLSFPTPQPPKGGGSEVVADATTPPPKPTKPKAPKIEAEKPKPEPPVAHELSQKEKDLIEALSSLEKFKVLNWENDHMKFISSEIDANPYLDLAYEAKKAHAWIIANPKKAKKDFKRFLHAWWERADRNRAIREPSIFAKPSENYVHPTIREFASIAARNWSAFCALRANGIKNSRAEVVRMFGAEALFDPAREFGERGGFAACANSQPAFLERDIRSVLSGWEPNDELPLQTKRGGRGGENEPKVGSSPQLPTEAPHRAFSETGDPSSTSSSRNEAVQ